MAAAATCALDEAATWAAGGVGAGVVAAVRDVAAAALSARWARCCQARAFEPAQSSMMSLVLFCHARMLLRKCCTVPAPKPGLVMSIGFSPCSASMGQLSASQGCVRMY